MLRRSGKPIITVVNKVDSPKDEASVYDFYALGTDNLFAISSSQGLGLGDLLDAVIAQLGETESAEPVRRRFKDRVVAICRQKSSLVNALIGGSTIVDIAGTTRTPSTCRLSGTGSAMC